MDFMIVEALAAKMAKEEEEARKKKEREDWKKNPQSLKERI